jgi:hypothetical protein
MVIRGTQVQLSLREINLYKKTRLLGCDAMYSASKLSAFRRNLRFQGRTVLNLVVLGFSEYLLDVYQKAQRRFPEDSCYNSRIRNSNYAWSDEMSAFK